MSRSGAVEARQALAWDDPTDPTTGPPRRVFPVEALPELAARYVGALAAHFQVDPAMPAAAVLAAMSAAMVGRVTVHEWNESAVLWTAIAAASGEMKSPVARRIERALILPTEDAIRDADPAPLGVERENAEAAHADAERTVKALERRLASERAKPASDEKAALVRETEGQLAEAREVERDLRVPPVPRYVIDDATPEAIHKVLGENDGRVTAWIVEGTGLFHALSGKDAANVAPWLAAADGDPIRAARVTTERADVNAARMTLCMFVQPKVLAEGITGDALSYNGFHNRFLYVEPERRAGTRTSEPPAIDPFTESALSARLREIARDLWNLEAPRNLPLSAGARERFGEWFIEIDRAAAGPAADADPVPEMTSKLLGKALRLAGIFALVDDPEAVEISRETFRRAEAVAKFFHAQAWTMWGHSLTEEGEALRVARDVAKVAHKLRDEGQIRLADLRRYGTRPLRRLCTQLVHESAQRESVSLLVLTDAVRHLVQCNWLAPVPGKSNAAWYVSPLLKDEHAEALR